MRFEVLTLFPEAFPGALGVGLVGKALREGRFSVHPVDPRAFALDRHRRVDDTPYGGGAGMVMKVEPLVRALAGARQQGPGPAVLLSPQGRPLHQRDLERWAGLTHLILVAGRYEGFDERVRSYVDDEVSLGDYVLTGGEYAAQAVIDGVVRLLPGTLGNVESAPEDSFQAGLLEHPHFTRPPEFDGRVVPGVLTRGDHARIAAWRRAQSLLRTHARRPELLEAVDLSERDRAVLLERASKREPPTRGARGLGLALELRPEPVLLRMAEGLRRAYGLRGLALVAPDRGARAALDAWVEVSADTPAGFSTTRVYETWSDVRSVAPVFALLRDRRADLTVVSPRTLRGGAPRWLGVGRGLAVADADGQLPALRRATPENRIMSVSAAAIVLDRIWSES